MAEMAFELGSREGLSGYKEHCVVAVDRPWWWPGSGRRVRCVAMVRGGEHMAKRLLALINGQRQEAPFYEWSVEGREVIENDGELPCSVLKAVSSDWAWRLAMRLSASAR